MQCTYGLRDNEYILLRDTVYVMSKRYSVSTVLEVLHEYAFVRGTEYLLSKWYCVRTKRCCVGYCLRGGEYVPSKKYCIPTKRCIVVSVLEVVSTY